MKEHNFLITPKKWLGEGKIQLSMSEEELHYYTKWNADPRDNEGQISAVQEVQIQGLADMMYNHFVFSEMLGDHFVIELENATLGKIFGKGVIKESVIGWEFRNSELGFEGYELYQLQKDGSYLMQAEYSSLDQYRTMIKGKIWQKKVE